MRYDRKYIVPGMYRGLRHTVQACLFDGECSMMRDLLGKGQVVIGIFSTGFRHDQTQHPHDMIAEDEWSHDAAFCTNPPQNLSENAIGDIILQKFGSRIATLRQPGFKDLLNILRHALVCRGSE